MFCEAVEGFLELQSRYVVDLFAFDYADRVGIKNAIADAVRENVNSVAEKLLRVGLIIDVSRYSQIEPVSFIYRRSFNLHVGSRQFAKVIIHPQLNQIGRLR